MTPSTIASLAFTDSVVETRYERPDEEFWEDLVGERYLGLLQRNLTRFNHAYEALDLDRPDEDGLARSGLVASAISGGDPRDMPCGAHADKAVKRDQPGDPRNDQ